MKYLGIAFCVILLLLFAGCLIWGLAIKNSHPDDDNDEHTETDTDFPPCSEVTTQRVTVVGQTCSAKMIGTKTPKAVNEFLIYFKDEYDKTFSIPVPQDLYDSFEEGQTGTLSLVNGKLYGFELD